MHSAKSLLDATVMVAKPQAVENQSAGDEVDVTRDGVWRYMAGIGVAEPMGELAPFPFALPVDAGADCGGSASAMYRQRRRTSKYWT